MHGLIVVGSICILGGALGILMNLRMGSSRTNTVFAFGNALFFVGPIVLGIRSIAHSMKDIEYFAFGFAAVGLVVMSIGLVLGRRRNRV
jgi:uncharacterized membrane protein